MPSEIIPNASIQHVETALIEEYGRSNVQEKSRSQSSVLWTFKISSKAVGKCEAASTPSGVTVSMSAHTQMVLIIVTAVGYLFFIIPGLILTVFVVVARLITMGLISSRFPKMVDAVRTLAAKKAP